ncbi:7-deoxyloganetin glucosyltransferase-like [Prunus dulcis]|uniref:7-deoxyloganetin glucosyltransferase-like n=1 Tax=Prunus dulcis TaxID=3755 RepID=UPI001482978E|nr:7-deoxyloganetin glucosyltransferase-like [Prunus dulcis]XP_034221799.1 7-deoxyloganetin glucosyltransferase-like [Prunus dulcis]
MGTINLPKRPHAVCLPFPAQGHISPMMKFAKLLHHRGFHITFVNSEYNHKRLLKSQGPSAFYISQDFCFEAIPDGLLPMDADATQDIPSLCDSTSKTCLGPFHNLLANLSLDKALPPVTCIVSDGIMSFAVKVGEDLGIPVALFWTASACSFTGVTHYRQLIDKGLTPLRDEASLTNGYLDTTVDWIPGMKDIRLRDLPSFLRTTDPEDVMLSFALGVVERASKASAIILNTYDTLEYKVLEALSSMFPPIYTIGPNHLLVNKIVPQNTILSSIGSSLWKEEPECLQWLDSKEPDSVVYVNFGSITVMTPQQLVEFAWGLANSKKPFLWTIRPDLVKDDAAIFPSEFTQETKQRGLLVSWAPQEEVLNHPSIGGFLTHSGWNSTIESLSAGVPMVIWPFFADQQTNCWFLCTQWGVGLEIDSNVKRSEVEKLVRELMSGEKGKEMRKNAMEWKRKAEEATGPRGSSLLNLEKLVKDVLLQPSKPE